MTQTFITIPQEEWSRIVSILEKVEERLKPEDKWMTTKEACRMLGIKSPLTWISYRKKYNIKTSQVGRNVLTKKSEIERVLTLMK